MSDLFGNDSLPPADKQKGKRLAELQHAQLVQIYGKSEGQICKNCRHFIVKEFGNRYFKCGKATESSSPATDWRARWQACGKFEPG